MRSFERTALAIVSAVALLISSASTAVAQTYPSKTIRFVVPYPPGGASDVTARILGQKMTEIYGQPVIIENRPGANGNIALEHVARSQPDGYTILMGNVGPNAINAGLYPNLPFDPIKSFAPITLTSVVPMILVVTPTLPARNVEELIAHIKSEGGKTIFATGGVGSATHLTAALFKSMAGVEVTHVQYKGDVFSLNDVAAGHVKMTIVTVLAAAPYLNSGRVRVLGITTAKRSAILPEIPTIAEAGLPGFESVSWGGVLAPAGTPQPIIASLNTEIVKILRMPDVSEKISNLGAEIVGSSPEEFAAYLKAEVAKWSALIKRTGVTVD